MVVLFMRICGSFCVFGLFFVVVFLCGSFARSFFVSVLVLKSLDPYTYIHIYFEV